MSRCKCGQAACNCTVTAGTNVTVTGTGDANDPYVISSTGGGGPGGTYLPGDGLTEAPAGTFNVGAGVGVVVNADTVDVDLAALDARYAVPEVRVGGAAPTTGTKDLLWSNADSSGPGSATPGATSPLAPTFVRDGTTGTYFRATPAIVDDLRDVDTTTVAPTIGQSLTWNGTNWVPGAGGGGAQYIDQLLDVDTSTVPPVDGHTLVWASTQWVPAIRLREVVQATAPVGARQLRWVQPS